MDHHQCCMPTVTDIYPTMASLASISGTHDCNSCTSCTPMMYSQALPAPMPAPHCGPPNHFSWPSFPRGMGADSSLLSRPCHSHICSAIHLQFGLSNTMQGNRALSMKIQKLPNLTISLAGTHQSYIHSSSAESWPLTGPCNFVTDNQHVSYAASYLSDIAML